MPYVLSHTGVYPSDFDGVIAKVGALKLTGHNLQVASAVYDELIRLRVTATASIEAALAQPDAETEPLLGEERSC